MTKFYDTCALLELQEKVFDEFFYICDVTLLELNQIKENKNKTEELRYKTRNIIRLMRENKGKYHVVVRNCITKDILLEYGINEPFPDAEIVACAYWVNKNIRPILFCTYDLLCENLASYMFSLPTECASNYTNELYLGYKSIEVTDDEFAALIDGTCTNKFGCIENEYLIPYDRFNNSGYVFKMKDGRFEKVEPLAFKSDLMGRIKPMDLVQLCAFDSIEKNDITVLYGKSGSGKTIIPLSYIMKGLEHQKFRKIHIVYHYEPLKGAKTLGYEKGDHIEKILKTGSIGNILTSKLGDISIVESLIQEGKLDIIPTANIRGVEFGVEDVMYCTESQNIDIYTLKTIIQRCKSGCKQIYEGDIMEQTDISGISGLFKMIDVFKGNSKFGCIKLKNRYRDELSDLADKLC